jgi:hypothetical protein
VLHGNIHRNLLVLSLASWAVAMTMWMISACLGIARPTSLITCTMLFVIGLFAVAVAIGSYLLARFGTEPTPDDTRRVEPSPTPNASAPSTG